MKLSITRRNAALSWGASIALLQFLGACASEGTQVTEPRAVHATDRGDATKILYVEKQRLTRVFTPEGLKPSVLDFDIDYLLEEADGQRVPLPFLGARDASQLDVLNRVFHDQGNDTWVAMSVRSTQHAEHVQGMQWRYVDDDFTTIRVKAFSREHLVNKRDLHVCNPGRYVNPVIHVDTFSHTLRYCTKDGVATYDPAAGKERLLEPGPCCPSASGTANAKTRAEHELVVEVGR